MRICSRFLAHVPTLGLIALLASALVVAGCGGTPSATNAAPTATTAPPPTNTVPAATNTPAPTGPQAAIAVSGSGTYAFSPATMTIKVGTTVTWTNNTIAPHTVTSDSGDPASFNGSLSSGGTFSFTFTTAGTYHYHCTIHPYMKATITVTA